MSTEAEDKKVWTKAYAAAIGRGDTPANAKKAADKAVKTFQKRFPQEEYAGYVGAQPGFYGMPPSKHRRDED